MKTGKIYKIISSQGNEVYVGSTFNTTRDRFRKHKHGFLEWKADNYGKCSVFYLFDKYGVENCKMILIKEYEVLDRKHLEVYETLWIKKLKAINEREPSSGLLKKQYRMQWEENNRDKRRQTKKEYYKENKDIVTEKNKKYREENQQKEKQRKKIYRQNNMDKIKKKNANYYQSNKDLIEEKYSQKVNCICGSIIRKDSLTKHKSSIKHQSYIS